MDAAADLQFFLDNPESSEASAIADEEYGYDTLPNPLHHLQITVVKIKTKQPQKQAYHIATHLEKLREAVFYSIQ